ncbi:MAG: DNA polymerase III subunit beta [Campylobacterota bacterium]|nr:DNA polymerase III subunit beta [Campylobacterota bacterium]
MKFTIEKSKFENIIASMQPFLEKKDASSITSHIYLEISDMNLTIKATDYEMGLSANIDNLLDSTDGKATTNGANLLNIIRRLKDNQLLIETLDNHLHIKQNRSNFKLPMYDANEYPSFPKNQELQTLNIDTQQFIHSSKKITPAIDNNNPKFELNGALIDIKQNNINFVATDTRRLAVSHIPNESNTIMQVIIPKKAVVEIQKQFFDEAIISYDETNLIIKNQNKQFFTKLINGNFPDYQRIIPTSLKHNLTLPKDKLVESIKLVTSLFSNIKITLQATGLVFESLDEDTDATTQVDIDLNINEEFYIAANAKYLLDFLSMVDGDTISIGFNESNLPFYLENGNFFTIVMPIVLEK